MFKDRTGSFLGKKFEWEYPQPRKELKNIATRAIPGLKYSWKLNKTDG